MNCIQGHTNQKSSMAALGLAMLTFFILIAGADRPLQAQIESTHARVPLVTHNSWTSGSAVPIALQYPMVGVLKGQIYAVGGVTDTAIVANNQIYAPTTNSWSTGTALPVATADGTAAVVKNVLYVFGGTTDGSTATNAVWAYSPKTKTWSGKSAMPTARFSAAAAVEKNIIYVIGGNGNNGDLRLNTVESYNPATDTWTEEAPLIIGKSEPSVGLIGSTIIAADGFQGAGDLGENEGYSATTNAWTSLTADPIARNAACGGSVGANLYVAGGNGGTTVTESFKLSKNKWTTLASMPQGVISPGSAVNKGILYCFGGSNSGVFFQGSVFNYLQIYQP